VSRRALLGAALAACALVACDKTPEPAPSTAPRAVAPHATPSASASAAAKAPTGPTEVAWQAPARWKKVDNPNRMRLATYEVPRAPGDGEDAELTVSRAGGTVEMNVKRWAAQFDHRDVSQRSEKKLGDLVVTIVELHGSFTGMAMPGASAPKAKPHWAMIGAIVSTVGSPTFFKLTGPEKTVAVAKGEMMTMLDGLRAK
jgi:hypothetical protein